MLSYWAYVLIGNDCTGKTTFQKKLIEHLCGFHYKRLPKNQLLEISNNNAPKEFKQLFTMNRSYQESAESYNTIEKFFKKGFKDADICILSSHVNQRDIDEIMEQLKKRKYNVAAIFWSNCDNSAVEDISCLNWDERLYLENPISKKSDKIDEQITALSTQFGDMVMRRAHNQR